MGGRETVEWVGRQSVRQKAMKRKLERNAGMKWKEDRIERRHEEGGRKKQKGREGINKRKKKQ